MFGTFSTPGRPLPHPGSHQNILGLSMCRGYHQYITGAVAIRMSAKPFNRCWYFISSEPFHLLLAGDLLQDPHLIFLFLVIIVPFHCRKTWLFFFSNYFWPSHTVFVCVVPCPFAFLMTWSFSIGHIPLQLITRISPGKSLYLKMNITHFSAGHFC